MMPLTLDQTRRNAIGQIKTPKEYIALMDRYSEYYLCDIQDWSEATTRIMKQPFSDVVVLKLCESFMRFFDGRAKTTDILSNYVSNYYVAIMRDKSCKIKRYKHGTLEIENLTRWLVDPLIVGLSSERAREQEPFTSHPAICCNFVEAVFNIAIPNEYAGNIIGLIANKWNCTTTPETNFFELRDSVNFSEYDNPNEVESGIRQFIDYCYNLYSNDEYKVQFVQDVYQYYRTIFTSQREREGLSIFNKAFAATEEHEQLYNSIIWEIAAAVGYFAENYRIGNSAADITAKKELSDAYLDTIAQCAERLKDIYCLGTAIDMANQYVSSCILSTVKVQCTIRRVVVGLTDDIIALTRQALSNTKEYITNNEHPFFKVPELTDEVDEPDYATEAYSKKSSDLQAAQTAIYHAYKNYKNAEEKVDSQITKMVKAVGRLAIGDTRTEIIEGKKFSAIGLLKKALATAAIFSFGPLKGLITLVVRYALKKKTTMAERHKIILEMQVELDMINEKIEDAKGDGNRKAKYALMRTKAELEAALAKIKYGADVDERNLAGAKAAIEKRIGGK